MATEPRDKEERKTKIFIGSHTIKSSSIRNQGENVETLLAEAECGYEHVGHMIVYLRDMADYAVVREMYEERFPTTPKVYLLAPVCRPGWLIEMECMAVKAIANDEYPSF